MKYGEVGRCWLLVGRAPFPEGRALCKKGAPLWGRARPFGGGCAPVAYLIGRGPEHLLVGGSSTY